MPHANPNCKTGVRAAGPENHVEPRAAWHTVRMGSMLSCSQGSQDSVCPCRHGLWNKCQHTVGAQCMSPFVLCIATLSSSGATSEFRMRVASEV